MADKQIQELPLASALQGEELFVLLQGNQAKKLDWQSIYEYIYSEELVHGGIRSIELTETSVLTKTYTITFGDNSTTTFEVNDGNSIEDITQYFAVSASSTTEPTSWQTTRPTLTNVNKNLWTKIKFTMVNGDEIETTPVVSGVYGDTGLQTYVHIKWASQQPSASSPTIGDVPDKFIGILTNTTASASTLWSDYTWYEYKGQKGDAGDPASIEESTVEYGVSLSDQSQPSSWSTTMPAVGEGQYLWTRITITFNTGDPIVFYSKTRWGVNGSGTGTVTSVDGILPDASGNVIKVLFGNSAPSSSTVGAVKQFYIDTTNSVIYICTNVADNVYTWLQLGSSDISAEDVSYDASETYSTGTVGKILKQNSTDITSIFAMIGDVESALQALR